MPTITEAKSRIALLKKCSTKASVTPAYLGEVLDAMTDATADEIGAVSKIANMAYTDIDLVVSRNDATFTASYGENQTRDCILSSATTSTAGLISAKDKVKLDGIANPKKIIAGRCIPLKARVGSCYYFADGLPKIKVPNPGHKDYVKYYRSDPVRHEKIRETLHDQGGEIFHNASIYPKEGGGREQFYKEIAGGQKIFIFVHPTIAEIPTNNREYHGSYARDMGVFVTIKPHEGFVTFQDLEIRSVSREELPELPTVSPYIYITNGCLRFTKRITFSQLAQMIEKRKKISPQGAYINMSRAFKMCRRIRCRLYYNRTDKSKSHRGRAVNIWRNRRKPIKTENGHRYRFNWRHRGRNCSEVMEFYMCRGDARGGGDESRFVILP